ncbi:homoserine dehydrogenase [Azospirillum brasilense]|uniref:Homoserine dehydrogenase n=1 Tax=Azospirillum brasilense TaxID=192 RepID=A0A0P0F5X4_AZOBR|nr:MULTISPECIES: homoserine dehydrogenase [Azospirillum]ALJ35151.1 homoserine dehydrogenase [Azospirillum brasilense]MDW7553651.1 homoserine dehydrogenase [Azospirillum brasilense]MDW7594142.1 homoserine dehydrogenase [Azospirillum brasilense]MDW7629013.1 homoserine dehydrogenase [Azospirillum brasilense]MDX5953842.1 homoserine dehydrogenase [Azospirillum brasilense]
MSDSHKTGPLKIAVAGLGTVGAGVLKLLERQAALIEQRCGRRIEVVAVSARSRGKDRGVDLSTAEWYDDPVALAAHPGVDVVVELIGGSEGPAKETVELALERGRHVVTANKALLAHHGTALAAKAEAAGLAIGFEAAVAGGIPIIKGLREGLAGNRVSEVHGILNGTCNYILTEMRTTGRDFADVLADAQKLGYAEADPSFDIDGVDAAHKLAILTSVAFGTPVDFKSVHVEGIRHVAAVDFDYADALGYRIKLLGIARRTDHGIEQRVHPCMVPKAAPIAAVDGVFNAVIAQGDFVDRVLFVGRGAGEGPTASAVVADLIDIARGRSTPTFGVPAAQLSEAQPSPMEARRGSYYVRLMVVDRPGVIADVAAAMRDQNVSMEQFLQRGRAPGEAVPVVLTTHDTEEAAMQRALATIAAKESVVEPPRMIRIEQF